ncbi:Cytochrome c oxidase subunit 5b-2, mitochondrial [Apostasia shenzhenica]|uniref:Cytochrome c oxidase subunit 5b-2, mitochondrial n=1 Tax=Apostasia shenzhenica TaxID=1088818 RepID=A0A2I0A0I4_9ASPA|nr:Cytochrome c oxidase subunit 5b-2, mitochondrial [Apostasia shenzhenica]
MWRRVSHQLQALASWRSARYLHSRVVGSDAIRTGPIAAVQRTARFFSADPGNAPPPTKKRAEDVMPIATGLEREELEAELEGRKRFDMDPPVGPFGTKEAPAVIKSIYDQRIVGCPGGEGEDEHDVVWFHLEKGKPHECPVCSQYFVLEVEGPGGPPPEDGHGHDDEHH